MKRKIVEMKDTNVSCGYMQGERVEVIEEPTDHEKGVAILRSHNMQRNFTVKACHVAWNAVY